MKALFKRPIALLVVMAIPLVLVASACGDTAGTATPTTSASQAGSVG
jgi:hypothetical protein